MLVFGLIAALGAAISWAVSSALYKVGAKDISPLTANLLRIVPALLILTIGGLFINIYPLIYVINPIEWWLIFGSTLSAFVIGDALYFVALLNLGVSRTVPVTNIYPLFVLVLQITFLGQVVHLLLIPAALITVTGVALLGSQVDTSSSNESTKPRRSLIIGLVAAIVTPLAWSVSIIFLSQVLQTTNLVLVAVIRLILALVILTPMVMGYRVYRSEGPVNRRVWLFLGLGGVVALAVGYVSFAIALQLVDTTSVTLVSSLTPLFALIIGWRTLKERIDWKILLGVIACVVGIILTTIAVALV